MIALTIISTTIFAIGLTIFHVVAQILLEQRKWSWVWAYLDHCIVLIVIWCNTQLSIIDFNILISSIGAIYLAIANELDKRVR